ncbi:GNAT family N-acetyltransferase [Streptomyces bambusae]|uniref:GNAT family N-acetyltransferase n=1 Tax=Streptomyces bambusae TaxID=1550616 RepID=UPI001CFC521A|nr:GNAT family N-acetyltransferase [Streptomyces bambusae]MCB5165832.1 GNAT family N-acetyltransferase [Streptomyces bambusae]
MEKIDIRLEADATDKGPALLLRPWAPGDSVALAAAFQGDEALSRWTSHRIGDEAAAARWIREQQPERTAGDRLAFAVVERGAGADEGPLLGHVVLKGATPGASSAEVGYWTVAAARGRGVAPRAVQRLTDWAFATLAGDGGPVAGLTRLTLLHQVGNEASCRVAEKCGYTLSGTLPAAPPEYPQDGHLHVRERGA